MTIPTADIEKDENVARALAEDTLNEDDIHDVMMSPTEELWKPELLLTMSDKGILEKPDEWLNDRLIYGGMSLLKKQFPHISGCSDPVMVGALRCSFQGKTFVQVVHNGTDHWMTATNIDCRSGVVRLYDSFHLLPNQCVKQVMLKLVISSLLIKIDSSVIRKKCTFLWF